MTVLQTIALPLGYSAIRMARGRVSKGLPGTCQSQDLKTAARIEDSPEISGSRMLRTGPGLGDWNSRSCKNYKNSPGVARRNVDARRGDSMNAPLGFPTPDFRNGHNR